MRRTFPFFLLLMLVLSLAAAGCSRPSKTTASISGDVQASVPVADSTDLATLAQLPSNAIDPAILEASRTPISYSQKAGSTYSVSSSGQETPMGMPLGMTLSSSASGNENQAGPYVSPELMASASKPAFTQAELSAKKVGLILVKKIIVAEVPTRKPVEQKKAETGRNPRAPSSGPQPGPTPMKKLR